MEVMGLMLGEFVDEYTVSLLVVSSLEKWRAEGDGRAHLLFLCSHQVHVVDVFAMPQSGTSVTVESVDHVFQTKMLDMLKQTGR